MIKINMLQAAYGDTLLVQMGTDENGFSNILIDCGFNYKTGILPVLKKKLAGQTIHRFIITHYDSDHIKSAAAFLKDNGNPENPQIAPIQQIWLNTYRHLQFSKIYSRELDIIEKDKIIACVSQTAQNNAHEDNQGDIGAAMASMLGRTILEKKYQWNTDTNQKAICIENLPEIEIAEGVILQLLSPNKQRLQDLEIDFIDKLSQLGLSPNNDEIFDDAFELLNKTEKEEISYQGDISSSAKAINPRTINLFSLGTDYIKDNAPANGSSISFILKTENKKVLFLADAFAEDVIRQLKARYPDTGSYPIYFDAVKTAHHGSFRNNSPELLKIIDSDVFLFSTNGKHQSHKHPDVQTISCIINRPPTKRIKSRTLVFNYELEHLKDFDNEDLKTQFNYQIKIQSETIL